MTDSAEIERLLQMTGRTLKGLPTQEGYIDREDYRDRFDDVMSEMEATGFAHIPVFMIHLSDVIELLVGALRDALDKQPKWIGVKERLPKENTYYMVSVNLYGNRGMYTDIAMFDGELWVRDAGSYFDILDKGDITHFMPLPEPPEEEG
jgi:hypothetical protein